MTEETNNPSNESPEPLPTNVDPANSGSSRKPRKVVWLVATILLFILFVGGGIVFYRYQDEDFTEPHSVAGPIHGDDKTDETDVYNPPAPQDPLYQFNGENGVFPMCVGEKISRADFVVMTEPPGNEAKVKVDIPFGTSRAGVLPAYATYKGKHIVWFYRVLGPGESYHDNPPSEAVNLSAPYSESHRLGLFKQIEYSGNVTLTGQGHCDLSRPVLTLGWFSHGAPATLGTEYKIRDGLELNTKYRDAFSSFTHGPIESTETMNSVFPMRPDRDTKITVHNQYAELTATTHFKQKREWNATLLGWRPQPWVKYLRTRKEPAGHMYLAGGTVIWRRCCRK